MAGRPPNSVRMPKTSASIGCRRRARRGSCSGRPRCALDAVGDGAAHRLAVAGVDQVVGAELPADLLLGVAEDLGKARADVAEEVVLDDVDADQRVAQQAEEQPVRFADQVFGEGGGRSAWGGGSGALGRRGRQAGELAAVAFGRHAGPAGEGAVEGRGVGVAQVGGDPGDGWPVLVRRPGPGRGAGPP
jgi:hypothetical protein